MIARLVALCAVTLLALPVVAQTNFTCTYSTFQGDPLANLGSQANALNDYDDIAGTWSYEPYPGGPLQAHGFLRSNTGQNMQLSYSKRPFTYLNGINDSGTVVGYYQYQNHNLSAYGFTWSDGQFTSLQVPGSVYTEPNGINTNGDIVGWYAPADNPGRAFVYTGGQFRNFAYPGAFSTKALGINDTGAIVGYWEDSEITHHGMIYNRGNFQSVDYPGQTQTVLTGINDSGYISGYYIGPGPGYVPGGFLYKDGNFYPANIPNATSSEVLGINKKGDVSGFYQTSTSLPTAFLGTSCHLEP